jgi:hypothetical protein
MEGQHLIKLLQPVRVEFFNRLGDKAVKLFAFLLE